MSLIGTTDCLTCISRPSHRLIPCQHSVCYDHLLLGHDSESSTRSTCAKCRQTVIQVLDLTDPIRSPPSNPSASPSPKPFSPSRNIWATPVATITEHLTARSPPRAMSTWNHVDFVPQTPQKLANAHSPYAVRSSHSHSTNVGMNATASGGNKRQSSSSFAMSVGSDTVSNWSNGRPLTKHDAPKSIHGKGHDNDPFVDGNAPHLHQRVGSQASSSTSFSGGLSGHDQRSNAARLAQMIKSGMLEHGSDAPPVREPSGDRAPHDRNLGELMLQQSHLPPRNQPILMPEIRPDPAFLGRLAHGSQPSLEEAFEHIPFAELCRSVKPTTSGVVKIKNIPYGTTKNEIVAAVGRNTRLVVQPPGSPYYAIHIIMERTTGKTMDCFVELQNEAEVKTLVANFQARCANGRAPRIGDRHIDIEESNHAALMKELFPRAKCVDWDGQVPIIYKTDEPYNSGFRGFVNGEELVLMQKHAETPQRSPFAQRCHNRTYECLISTLHKYPWFAVDHITLDERLRLFNTTMNMLSALTQALRRNASPTMLTRQLLQELVIAVFTCKGLSPRQRASVYELVQNHGFTDVLASIVPPDLGLFGSWWAFEVLDKQPTASFGLLEYYIYLLRETSTTSTKGLSLAQLSAMNMYDTPRTPFGDFYVDYGDSPGTLTLAECAAMEWNAVEKLLREALVSAKAITAY